MFTLGTAFGAGIGGAIVALADAGTLVLPVALTIVFGLTLAMSGLVVAASLRVPRGPSDRRLAEVPRSGVLEHS
jgi:hypothetical protein